MGEMRGGGESAVAQHERGSRRFDGKVVPLSLTGAQVGGEVDLKVSEHDIDHAVLMFNPS
jgi:hypothetical protein